jgi:hypothetical protein
MHVDVAAGRRRRVASHDQLRMRRVRRSAAPADTAASRVRDVFASFDREGRGFVEVLTIATIAAELGV